MNILTKLSPAQKIASMAEKICRMMNWNELQVWPLSKYVPEKSMGTP
jgi:hypothetical protein